jgi:hypothetical protein
VDDLGRALRKISQNYTRNIWYLKLDIKKFFASVDHEVLLRQLKNWVCDPDIIWLLEKIIDSYSTPNQLSKGVPIGNLTSQIFANIYMNELDYFAKFNLREKYYFRYADDFIFLNNDREYLENLLNVVSKFVEEKLCLTIHPDKIFLKKFSQGVDFLGYVLLPHHRVLRTKTKQRMFKKTKEKVEEFNNGLITDSELGQTVQSYFGMLMHCEGYELKMRLKNEVWINKFSKLGFT